MWYLLDILLIICLKAVIKETFYSAVNGLCESLTEMVGYSTQTCNYQCNKNKWVLSPLLTVRAPSEKAIPGI